MADVHETFYDEGKGVHKKYWQIAGLTLLHAAISWGMFLFSFAAGMSRFDTGAAAGIGERAISLLSRLLFWPIYYPLVEWGPRPLIWFFDGLLGYIPILLNSLIWGVTIWWLCLRHKKVTLASAP
ncbi:MAG TPA: hypothetical protein VMG30_16485 [Acidobacteriota bacterium]|nr:hypothetical protein [Acidobacteriota bacterium]